MGVNKTGIELSEARQRAVLKIVMGLMTVAVIIISTVMLATSATMLSNYNSKMNDYLFELGLSFIFLVEMMLPTAAEKIFKIRISPAISFVYIIHCFGGTYLGNAANMYYIIPHFDSAMHFLVGLNLSMLGLALVQFFNRNTEGGGSALFMAVMVLFTGVALSTFWEVFEFTADVVLDINMQGYANESSELLIGQAAIMDTMIDILLDIAGAIAVAVPTYISIKRKKNWHKLCTIKKMRPLDVQKKAPAEESGSI